MRRELALELPAAVDERAHEPADHEHRRRPRAVADPAELVVGRQIQDRCQAQAHAGGDEASPEPEPDGAEGDGDDHEHARSVLRAAIDVAQDGDGDGEDDRQRYHPATVAGACHARAVEVGDPAARGSTTSHR